MNIVVTGSREWTDVETIRAWLAFIQPARVAHGGCRTGADQIAGRIARSLGIEVVEYPVDEEVDGPWPAAGPRRNARMLELEQPDRVVAFSWWSPANPKGLTSGTADCCSRALTMGRPVVVIPPGARP